MTDISWPEPASDDKDRKQTNPQKYSWKKHKVFASFVEANEVRNELLSEGNLVKVRRCGPDGSQFKVVIGSAIKTNTNKKGKKKGKKNATE